MASGAVSSNAEVNKLASEKFDVVVVGAGLAGLTAAYNIKKKDPQLRVLVLEARDRVGGRTLTKQVKAAGGTEDSFDLGGQWVGPTQDHVLRLLEELKVETYLQNVSGTKVMQLGEKHVVRTYSSTIPSMGSVWALVDFQLFIWRIDRMARQVSMACPASSPLAAELEGVTVAGLCDKYLSTREARECTDVAVKSVFGTDIGCLDALFFLAYANAAGGILKLCEAKGAAQEARVKGGTQPISERLADLVGRDNITLSRAVTHVDQTSQSGVMLVSHREVRPETSRLVGAEVTVRAKKVVVTVPPNLVNTIAWSPPLHPLKQYICQSLPMGRLSKFVVSYDKAYWLEKGYSGEIVTNGGPPLSTSCSTGPISSCFDATTNNGTPAIVGFMAGRTGVEWSQRTKKEREAAVTGQLADLIGPELRSYVAYEEKIWSDDPWAGGCPVGCAVPGTLYAWPHVRTPHLNVHFAGTETATVWTGYMSGAVQSGERAALEVLKDLRPTLLTEDENRIAKETSREYDQRLPPAPSSAGPLKLLTAAAAGGAVVAAAVVWLW